MQWTIDMMTNTKRVEQYCIPRKADIDDDLDKICVSLFSGLNVMLKRAAAITNSSLESSCASASFMLVTYSCEQRKSLAYVKTCIV